MSCCEKHCETVDPLPWCSSPEPGSDLEYDGLAPIPEGDESCQGLNAMRMVGKPEGPELCSPLTWPSDTEKQLMRSISLRKTLFRAHSFWFADPHARSQAQKKQLFCSSETTDGFHFFFSHSWNTSGRLKFLSLLLQFGWPTIMSCWACGVILGFALCMLNVLPLFELWQAIALDFNHVIPSSCWMQVFGLIGVLSGCLLFPHMPFYKKDKCFLDFACIDQTDKTKTRQGIMSISAFLAASEELRVLWSPPLLSRLWCVFEIAAFRKLNPDGRIVIAPVSNDVSECILFLWWQVACFAYWQARAGPDGGNPSEMLLVVAVASATFLPAMVLAVWQQQKSSAQLRSELANFDVMNVNCSSDFDREYIHDAIITWYGSLEAFSAHMRGPFSQEVLNLLERSAGVSFHYVYLPITPLVCLCLDNFLALAKADAPPETLISFFFSQVVAYALLYLPAVGVFWMWVAKRGLWLGNCRCKPFALEICIILILCVNSAATGAYTAIVSGSSVERTLLWNGSAAILAGVVRRFCWHAK